MGREMAIWRNYCARKILELPSLSQNCCAMGAAKVPLGRAAFKGASGIAETEEERNTKGKAKSKRKQRKEMIKIRKKITKKVTPKKHNSAKGPWYANLTGKRCKSSNPVIRQMNTGRNEKACRQINVNGNIH